MTIDNFINLFKNGLFEIYNYTTYIGLTTRVENETKSKFELETYDNYKDLEILKAKIKTNEDKVPYIEIYVEY